MPSNKHNPEMAIAEKALALADVTLLSFLDNKYALWLDMRTTDDIQLHGSGRCIENRSDGITIKIAKTAGPAGAVNIYLFIIVDAQMNIENGRLVNVLY